MLIFSLKFGIRDLFDIWNFKAFLTVLVRNAG